MSTEIISRENYENVYHFREDGYFNMTKAAQAFGKEVYEFTRLPSTLEYIEALANILPNFNTGISTPFKPLITERGRYGGTWGHPKLAVFFAQWLDVKFLYWCDTVMYDLIHGNAEITITKPDESSALICQENFADALRLAADLQRQKQKAEQEST